MSDPFLIFVVILFVLAILDLMVGVSNDAVNFLNSALGSKSGTRNLIMVVASLGVFVGATFSSGMMEVARKGIFHPELFSFYEIMAIFLAVMITDILLLDLFNTLGLPTSTTVSIVFELLGAAVAISLIKMSHADQGFAHLGEYINTSKALAIISGILLSVAVAFTVGALIQYLSRLIFTFDIKKRMKYVGALWSGLALAALTYFLLIKGMKGASFITQDTQAWIQSHTLLILGLSFVGWTILLQGLLTFFKVNILQIIVLFGTFALAMAFAGNDLVNFIGVPIAGLESFTAWSASGLPAEGFSMEILGKTVATNTWLLLGAGTIMVLTLWFSKKARTVTETTIDLSRQEEGSERFRPHGLARGLVRGAHTLSAGLGKIMPRTLSNKMENNFQPYNGPDADPTLAFDQVRAAVTLTVASMLIAVGTSLKLPLSTTYVTFMVAMGASLADRAWGRDSAVYRVSGVVNVIGGWFMTALAAFTTSAIFAVIIYNFGVYGVGALLGLVVLLVVRGMVMHRKSEKEKEARNELLKGRTRISSEQVEADTCSKVAGSISLIRTAYEGALQGLIQEDRSLTRKAKEDAATLKTQNERLRFNLFTYIRRIEEEGSEGSRIYLSVFDLEQDMQQSIEYIVKACSDHVENVHAPLKEKQARELNELRENTMAYLEQVALAMQNRDFKNYNALLNRKNELLTELEEAMDKQVKGIKDERYNARNSMLCFSIFLETKDLLAVAARFVKLYRRLEDQETQISKNAEIDSMSQEVLSN